MSNYHIVKVSKFGHKILDNATNECLWDIPTGSCVFTLEEAKAILRKAKQK
jgi:hypothetical protein